MANCGKCYKGRIVRMLVQGSTTGAFFLDHKVCGRVADAGFFPTPLPQPKHTPYPMGIHHFIIR